MVVVNSKCKFPEMRVCSEYLRNSKGTTVARVKETTSRMVGNEDTVKARDKVK